MISETQAAEEPPVLVPIESPRRAQGGRLRHLLYAVLYCALFCWIGVLTGLLLISGIFGAVVAMVIGGVVIYGRRRSTQQDALLWALAIASERGMPLAPTLDAFAGQCRGEYRRKVLAAAYYLRQGLSLTEAIDREPGLFPRDVAILVRVGSESGGLAGALRESSAGRSESRAPWVALAIRLAYLLGVLIVMQSIVAFISYFVLPKFEAIFSDFGVPLPSVTIFAIEVTHFLINWWPIFLLLMLLQLGMLMFSVVSILGVLPWDLPLIDRLFLRRHSAMVLRCLARVVEGDRPLPQGLATLASTYPSSWIRARLRRVAKDVNQGDDWCEALVRRGLIRPAEAVLLEAARRVGNLPWALREAAENAERRLAYQFQAGVQWLLPLLVMAIGAVVFVVAVAYFTPIVMLIQRLAP